MFGIKNNDRTYENVDIWFCFLLILCIKCLATRVIVFIVRFEKYTHLGNKQFSRSAQKSLENSVSLQNVANVLKTQALI